MTKYPKKYNYNIVTTILNTSVPLKQLSFTVIMLGLLLVQLSGCTKEASGETVEVIASQFYESIQKKEFDHALSYYEDNFFNLHPRKAWTEHLLEVNNKLGLLKSVKLKHKNTSTVFSGRRFVFVFNNQYEKGLAKETLIFFQHVSKPGIKIQSHKIESSALPGSQSHR